MQIVELTPEQAAQFILFQKHFSIFNQLLAHNVFNIGWGKCTLNFADHELQNVIREEVVWRK